ncbi:MAG: DNA mismatch repair endonuclease MutL [Clostridia bacterium]|nr:DNA mismatch repair endonuclease MutL [Clostridia bacterium]
MARIEKLSPHLADLIAAGEVVERPASVVKELVENAIDAGARAVTVELVRGGMEEISVTDDGCGMSREDARTAFLRHATSKLKSESDLAAIGTLGFRGEALAAISAVSRVELTTCEKGAELGTFLYLEAGEIREEEEVGCPEGTTIRIRELFYNTPARLKFVKKDASEGGFASAAAEKCALAHPEVAVTLIREGVEIFRTPGDGDLYSCLYCLYGADFARGLLPVDYTYESASVKGFVTRPEKARGNRTMQNFFVNNRPVKNRLLSVAIEEACRGSIMVGKFPSGFFYITVDPAAVDVNVHPTKSEVKFAAEKDVFDALYFGVKSAAQRPVETSAATFAMPEPTPVAEAQTLTEASAPAVRYAAPPQPAEKGFPVPAAPQRTEPAAPAAFISQRPPEAERTSVFSQTPASAYNVPTVQTKKEEPQGFAEREFRIIGEFARLYILVECGEELIVVDKHAVHERILYEELKSRRAEETVQVLLKPVVVNLSGEDMAVYAESAPLLAAAGFECEIFGEMSIVVRAVPLGLGREDVVPAVTEVLQAAANRRDALEERRDRVLHTVACRAAIKAGQKNALPELAVLVRRALFDPAIRYCPHGRPVKWSLDKKELEKRFGRSGNLA